MKLFEEYFVYFLISYLIYFIKLFVPYLIRISSKFGTGFGRGNLLLKSFSNLLILLIVSKKTIEFENFALRSFIQTTLHPDLSGKATIIKLFSNSNI